MPITRNGYVSQTPVTSIVSEDPPRAISPQSPEVDRSPIPIDFQDLSPTKVVTSSRSVIAYHSTLFEDFSLRAEAIYNRFTEDETENSDQDESVPARSLPRYVELFWRPVPTRDKIELGSGKGTRPKDPRSMKASPVLRTAEALNSVANGFIQPGAVDALLTPPIAPISVNSFDEDRFLMSERAGGLSAGSFSTKHESEFHVERPRFGTQQARVTFLDPSIGGALDENRIGVSQDTAQLTSLGSISKLIPSLEVMSEFTQDIRPHNPPPVFPAPVDSPTLLYVGYVIERHEPGPSGSMRLSRTITVDDPQQRRVVDRKVKFGVEYLYRMRTVAQWSHPPGFDFQGPSTIKGLDFDVGGAPRMDASFYASDWSDWVRARITDDIVPDPPDELTVRPVSVKGVVDVTWRMPNDPQRDVRLVRLLRCVETSGKLGRWSLLGEFPAANGRFVDRSVEPYSTGFSKYVYAMYSVSAHGELSRLSEQFEVTLSEKSRDVAEVPVRQVASRGADPLGEPWSSRESPRDQTVIASGQVTFYVRQSSGPHPLHDRTYVVEVQSLSTGERSQVTLSVDSTDIDVGTKAVVRRA